MAVAYPRILCLAAALTLAAASGPARADWSPLELLLDNGVRRSTNELPPTRGTLRKKYPLRWMVDGDPRTAWVFEGDRNTTPEIRITVPGEWRPDRLRIVNGHAKSRALYGANNRVSALSVGQDTHRLAETLRPQEVRLDGTTGDTLVIRLTGLARGARYDDTCVSELDLLARGVSLLRSRTHVRIGGGEYPTHALYRGNTLLAAFPPEAVMEAFFIRNGAYAVFVHPAEAYAPGVTIYSATTRKKRLLLADLAIHYGTLKWDGGRFVGRALDPRSDKTFPFARRVRLP